MGRTANGRQQRGLSVGKYREAGKATDMTNLIPRPMDWQAASQWFKEQRRFPGFTQAEIDTLRCPACTHVHRLDRLNGHTAMPCDECRCGHTVPMEVKA